MAAPDTREIWFEGVFMRLLVSAAESGGTFSAMEHWLPANWSPPEHVHRREDQLVHVIEGELLTRVGEVEQTVSAGHSIFLPRDVPHTFLTGSSVVKLLELNVPAGFEAFHIECGEPAPEARIPDRKEPDVEKLQAFMARYGAAVVGPPMSRA